MRWRAATYVAGTPGCSGTASEGNCRTSGRYPEGRPCRRHHQERIDRGLDSQQAGSRSEAVEVGRRRRSWVVGLLEDQWEDHLQPDHPVPELGQQPDVPAPLQPCAGSPLPSYEPSIPCEFL